MRTINRKNENVIDCDCGNVIEFEKSDYVLQKTEESGDFYAICVKCPACGCLHVRSPKEYDGGSLIASIKGEKRKLNDCSLEEIESIINSATAPDDIPFEVGEEKEIVLKDGSTVVIKIAGKFHDESVSGEKVPITFCFKDLYGTENNGGHTMNSESTNKGGWDKCGMRKYLNEEFILLLPDKLLSMIKTVKKKTASSGNGKIAVSEDKIFIPSEIEVFGKTYYSKEGEGEQYELFKKWINRVKGYPDSECGKWWWLRSPYSGSNYNFCSVSSSGYYSGNGASTASGVSPCFAI